jgi:hypothetical protein
MEHVKLHLLVTVLLTQVTSLCLHKVSYFPTEISHTAASGIWSNLVFRIGMCSTIVPLYISGNITQQTFCIWISLCVIALFDTIQYLLVHMLGVAMLLLSCAVFSKSSTLPPVFVCTLIYLLRAVLKGVATYWYEVPDWYKLEWFQWLEPNTWKHILGLGFNRHQAIIELGAKACKYPGPVMMIFKIAGVLQWVALYALTFMFP